MATAISVALPLLAVLSDLAAAETGPTVAVELAFRDFVVKYERNYTTKTEEEHRYATFKENYAFIQVENAKDHWYTLGVNEFTDLSAEEFAATHLGLSAPVSEDLWGGLPNLGVHNYSEHSGVTFPASVDWVRKNKVTSVKNQGHCGACWTFSSTGAIEGAWAIATHALVSLSEQQLLNCVPNRGCQHGGSMRNAFRHLTKMGMCSEDSYPYKGSKFACAGRCKMVIPKGALVGYRTIPRDNEYALMSAVSQQPVSIAVDGSTILHHYTTGIINSGCNMQINHGVLAVGYGTSWGRQYWKVKNSWGRWWGEGGYFRLRRGCICGMCKQSSYPVVKKLAEEYQELLV